jgi:O-antigen/teichoic acid export membrane protein
LANPVHAAMREDAEAPMNAAGRSRAQRLLGGWSANLFQIILGVTQQLALVPIFLHYCSSEMLAAWLALYAAGSLVLIADAGLQSRVINRFLAFKSCADPDGRTARYFAAMERLYVGLTVALVVSIIVAAFVLRPSFVLGFRAIADFDVSFVIMTAGMLLVLPSNLASGLYRARGLYGRAVWIQSAAMLTSQLAQIAAIVATGRLTMIAAAFVAPQVLSAAYVVVVDVRRMFPILAKARASTRFSWHWIAGQFRRAFPFAIAGSTEIALQNLPVLLVSAIVVDRVAVAQWGLTRVVAGLVRALCTQATLPLAAELGHDRAVGAKQALRHLYARGSALVTLLASLVVSGLLAFWRDFFELWTHGAVPYDLELTLTLLIGATIVAPTVLALGYGYYSDRGEFLAWTKGLQLVAFVALSLLLTPWLGPLGMAFAVVVTDVAVQFGLLATTIIRETLQRPARHIAFLVALMIIVTACGWGLGAAIQSLLPLSGFARFITGCALWLFAVAIAASPLTNARLRSRLAGLVPS